MFTREGANSVALRFRIRFKRVPAVQRIAGDWTDGESRGEIHSKMS